MKQPDCFEFGMQFLGDPEETEVRKYVKWLEARVTELEAAQPQVAEKDYPHRKVTCMKCDYVNKFTLVSDFTAADAKRWEEQS